MEQEFVDNEDPARVVKLTGRHAATAMSKHRIFIYRSHGILVGNQSQPMKEVLLAQAANAFRKAANDCILKEHGIPNFFDTDDDYVDEVLSSKSFLKRMGLDT